MKQTHRTLFFDPRYITFIDISSDCAVQAIKTISFENGQFEQGIICNPTHIGQLIEEWKRINGSANITHIIIKSPQAKEQFFFLSSHNATRQEIPIPFSHDQIVAYKYVYAHDQQYCYYSCTISRLILLQYTLLAEKHDFFIETITSSTNALLDAYKKMYGPVFRETQLGIDMLKYNNQVEYLLNKEMVSRVLKLNRHVISHEQCIPLLTAYGCIK